MKNILIADDHSIVRLGIRILVQDILGNANVDFAESTGDILSLIRQNKYDLLITDINMPGGEGVMSVSNILKAQPDLKILILSVNPENIFAKRYLKAGVYGYVQKNNSDENIKNAVRVISLGKRYFSPELMQQLSEIYLGEGVENPFDRLSNREFQIAMMVLQGYGLSEISNMLNVHISTVSTHKARLFEKLGVENVVELVSLAAVHRIAEDAKVKK